MTTRSCRFYRGEGRDGAGRTIDDVWAFSTELSRRRTTSSSGSSRCATRSAFVPGAPTLTDATIDAFRGSTELRDRLSAVPRRDARVLRAATPARAGRRRFEPGRADAVISIEPGADLAVRGPRWWGAGNHNHLRLTRIIASLSILGLEPEARALAALPRARPRRASHRDLRRDGPLLGEGRQGRLNASATRPRPEPSSLPMIVRRAFLLFLPLAVAITALVRARLRRRPAGTSQRRERPAGPAGRGCRRAAGRRGGAGGSRQHGAGHGPRSQPRALPRRATTRPAPPSRPTGSSTGSRPPCRKASSTPPRRMASTPSPGSRSRGSVWPRSPFRGTAGR